MEYGQARVAEKYHHDRRTFQARLMRKQFREKVGLDRIWAVKEAPL